LKLQAPEAKDTKTVVGWSGANKSKVRCGCTNRLSRKMIKEVGGGMKALDPIASRNGGLKRVEHDVVSSVNHMLSLAILGRSIGA
jgi:hypothetical protein